jgi:hypothetical protein
MKKDTVKAKEETRATEITLRILETRLKAEELILKYLRLQEPHYNWFHRRGLAKECALIAVDEILDALDKSLIHADIEWWIEVKQEIEKL